MIFRLQKQTWKDLSAGVPDFCKAHVTDTNCPKAYCVGVSSYVALQRLPGSNVPQYWRLAKDELAKTQARHNVSAGFGDQAYMLVQDALLVPLISSTGKLR
jgi:hypothetical protein